MKNISFLFGAFFNRFIIALYLSRFTIVSANAVRRDAVASFFPSPSVHIP